MVFLAYSLLGLFVLSTTIGGFLIAPPLGFIILGLTSGLVAFLLGVETE